jgi:hypothetical protein
MPLYDELKTLSVHLSPSYRVAGSELGDVLSALVAFTEHGEPILTAAAEGPQALYDFLHEHQAKLAAAAGQDPPVKGQPLQHQPAPGRFGPPPAVSRADFEKLTGLVEQLLAAQTSTLVRSAPAAAVPVLTPDQARAVERGRQILADAETFARDTPESD